MRFRLFLLTARNFSLRLHAFLQILRRKLLMLPVNPCSKI